MNNENTGFSVSQFLTQGSKKKDTSNSYGKDKKTSSNMSYNANKNKKKRVSKENNKGTNNLGSNNKDKGNVKITLYTLLLSYNTTFIF